MRQLSKIEQLSLSVIDVNATEPAFEFVQLADESTVCIEQVDFVRDVAEQNTYQDKCDDEEYWFHEVTGMLTLANCN